MKKNPKKLQLSRETVRHLNGPGLRRAAGGGITDAGFGDCTNNTTQTTTNCGGGPAPSGFAGSCRCETSNGPYACICNPPDSQ